MPSKKSFKDSNPALDYISFAKPIDERDADNDVQINQNSTLNKIIDTVKKPETKQEESRTKRVSLIVQPSLYDDLEIAATIYRTSINDLCNTILLEYIGGKKEQINKFRILSSEILK